MKFFKLDLLTLLISLFILNSCKNQDSIGLGVNSANQLSGSLIDTSTIIVNTVPEDTVVTSALGKTPLAFFNDPIFGTTEANLAIDLNLPGVSNTNGGGSYTVPTGSITIDSAILVLRYATGFYGDSLASRYKVNVYQLGERLFTGTNYYNTKQWKYNSGTLLGTQTFFSRTLDSIKLSVIVAGGPDTLQKAPPQLRIPIDKNFINANLFNASATQLGSNLVFRNNVNGLYITMDKTKSTGAGGIFLMALDSTARIDVYYRNTNGTTTDTTLISLPSFTHAGQIKHTYPAAIQTAINNKTTSGNSIYLQGGGGLKTKISFPYIKNLLKTLGTNIVINRAELVITPTPGSTIPFYPLPQIAMYRYDISHTPIQLEDASTTDPRSGGVTTFGGFYSNTLLNYHFVITAYIQDLILGTTVDYGTFIAATDFNTGATTTSFTPTAQTAARTFAVGTDKTSAYQIKLNIIYTKIPK